MFQRLILWTIVFIISLGCSLDAQPVMTITGQTWPERIAQSFLLMHPDSINYPSEMKSRRWNYEQGLMLEAFFQMWQLSGDSSYFKYIVKNLDYYIQEDGTIRTYKFQEYQLDNITPGKAALRLYEQTKKIKYRLAADTLRHQLSDQPRTQDGGFWHKKIYPYQMWLDGLYMAGPFYAWYAVMFNDTAALDDMINQFLLIAKHSYDNRSGLYFHGWDESKQQRWANPLTGCSPNLWGRSLGWFAMALVDVLEYIPETHPKRTELLKILNSLALNMLKQRDERTKLWYQVVNKPNEKGNYLEASVSTMMAYTFAKGANRGYLPIEFLTQAKETWMGVLEHLVSIDTSGVVHLTHVCSVGGLGGNPYRDGSVEYYVGELRRTDDFKGYGPFLLTAIELERSKDIDR
jgi:unsaturated rhamnogalacturonyl hydrolase